MGERSPLAQTAPPNPHGMRGRRAGLARIQCLQPPPGPRGSGLGKAKVRPGRPCTGWGSVGFRLRDAGPPAGMAWGADPYRARRAHRRGKIKENLGKPGRERGIRATGRSDSGDSSGAVGPPPCALTPLPLERNGQRATPEEQSFLRSTFLSCVARCPLRSSGRGAGAQRGKSRVIARQLTGATPRAQSADASGVNLPGWRPDRARIEPGQSTP